MSPRRSTRPRIGYRTWLPLFYWILNQAVVNAYKLGCINGTWTRSHLEFREELYTKLWTYADKMKIEKWKEPGPHHWKALDKRRTCVWCSQITAIRKEIIRSLSSQSTAAQQALKDITNLESRPKAPNATWSACTHCDVALCKMGNCWTQWHSQ